jgi:tetratricopeptide (TPR) repeat protein
VYAPILGLMVDNYEPVAWAEQLIEPARAVDHPRLATLYTMASLCWLPGRTEEAVRYADAGHLLIASGRHVVPFGLDGAVGSAYTAIGQPERSAEWCRAWLARGRDTYALTKAFLVLALTVAGCGDEARAAAVGLIDAAEVTGNPYALSWALYVHGSAFSDADPAHALEALRRGLAIARDSGNRFTESRLVNQLARIEAQHGDPLTALDYVTETIRHYRDAGNASLMRIALIILAAFFDRLGRYEPAATIAGFAISPFAAAAVPEINAAIDHLRDVLSDHIYDSLAHMGTAMTTAEMATYAYDQIDQARAELKAVSK